MEFSGKIDWKRLDMESKISNWSLTEDLFKNHSLQKYFDSHDMLKKVNTDIKQDNTVPDVTPKVPEPRVSYPRISDLSIEEQKYFLDTYKEYISGKEIGSENLNQLQNLMWKLSSEQEEFLRFLQEHSLSAKEDYNFLHPGVKNEIQNTLEAGRCQVQQNFAPLYTLFQTVGLSSGAVFPNDPILTYKRTLKQAVGQSLLSLPNIKIKQKSLLESDEYDVSTCCQLWQDPVACDYAKDNTAHFVLTAEALQTLIDNHPPEYEKDWELPITVTDQLEDSNDATSECSKTIMIGDPLPPKSVKPRQANVMYYRRRVCDILRKPRDNQYVSADMSKSGTAVENNSEMPETMDITNDLTLEGDTLKPVVENLQELDEDVNMTSDKTPKNGNVSDEILTKIGLEEEKNVDSDTRSTNCNEVNESLIETQFTYSLWRFGHFNLLIRTEDCGLLYQANNAGTGSLHPANVFIKPEYQLTYGCEQLTTSEASRWWINTYIIPDSLCIFARINPVTAQLLKLDVLNQSSILTLSSFDPAKPMKMIHGILTRLEKLLRPGKYILSHSAKDMHACVYEVMNEENDSPPTRGTRGQGARLAKKASYDLHLAHSKDREVLVYYEQNLPWVPIDPNIFFDWHIAYHRIPLTFPPVSKEELKKIRERNANNGKKKKKKGKKTKKTPSSGFKGKAGQMESKLLVNKQIYDQINQPNQSIHGDNQAQKEEDVGISQRLRSRARPVTYDDINFDF